MNIAFVSSFSYLDHVVCLLNALSPANRIVLYLVDVGDRPGLYSKSSEQLVGRSQYEHLRELDRRVEIVAVILPALTARNVGSWRIAFKVVNQIRKGGFDVCHIEYVLTQFLPLVLIKHLALVADIHDPFPHTGEPRSLFLALRLKLFLQHSSAIIIHNQHLRAKFERRFNLDKTRVYVVPLGILYTYTKWTSQNTEQDGTILFFGRIYPYKGLEYLAQAWPIIRESVANSRLLVAGKGERYFDMSVFERDPRVEFHFRYISNAELVSFILRASVIVVPYLDATQSGVVLTAYAFGKPVVATNVEGLRDVVEDGVTGFVVPPKDHERLANAIMVLLNNHSLRRQMAQTIMERSHHEFAWLTIAERTIAVYEKATQTLRNG